MVLSPQICRIDSLEWDMSEVIINNSTTFPYKDVMEGFHDTPLGMYWFFINQSMEVIGSFRKNPLLNSKLLLVSFKPTTDRRRRGTYPVNRKIILNNLEKNGFRNVLTSNAAYFRNVGMYKFVASPEGTNKGLS